MFVLHGPCWGSAQAEALFIQNGSGGQQLCGAVRQQRTRQPRTDCTVSNAVSSSSSQITLSACCVGAAQGKGGPRSRINKSPPRVSVGHLDVRPSRRGSRGAGTPTPSRSTDSPPALKERNGEGRDTGTPTCSTRLIHWKLSSSEASGRCSATSTIRSSCSTVTENTAILEEDEDKRDHPAKDAGGRTHLFSLEDAECCCSESLEQGL